MIHKSLASFVAVVVASFLLGLPPGATALAREQSHIQQSPPSHRDAGVLARIRHLLNERTALEKRLDEIRGEIDALTDSLADPDIATAGVQEERVDAASQPSEHRAPVAPPTNEANPFAKFVQPQDPIQLGEARLEYRPANALDVKTPISQGIRSYRFLSGVGGVAFDGAATSGDGSAVVGIEYLPTNSDGQRLVATLAIPGKDTHQRVVVHAADWMLIPLINYVAHGSASCFTLFGTLRDAAESERRLSRSENVLNYHPSMENSLLGLRLFQADILVIDQNACDLPKGANGYILGAGELVPDLAANSAAWTRVSEDMTRLHPNVVHRSYLICDVDRPVTFLNDSGVLKLTGTPIWHCWQDAVSDEEFAKLWDQANSRANVEANRILQEAFERDQTRLSAAQFEAKWTPEYQQGMYELQFEALFDEIVSRDLIRSMPKYSRDLTRLIESNGGINPAVYSALVDTMRLSALLRHIKRTSPSKFDQLATSISGLVATPRIRTPTILKR